MPEERQALPVFNREEEAGSFFGLTGTGALVIRSYSCPLPTLTLSHPKVYHLGTVVLHVSLAKRFATVIC